MNHNHPILSLLVLTFAIPFLVSCGKAAKDTTAEDNQAIKAASRQRTSFPVSTVLKIVVALDTQALTGIGAI